jgi:hypothetical protein
VLERSCLILAAVAVLAVAGCGGGEPEATPTPTASASSVAPSSAAPSSTAPTPSPTPSSAAPSSPSASPTPTGSASPASTENGTYANELSLSEDGALSYVPLRWYSGANAKARCQEKDVKPEGAFCEEYYYEKDGGRKSAALTEATKVRLLNDDLKPANASLTDLVQAIEDESWPNFQIALSGSRVTQITQVFTP